MPVPDKRKTTFTSGYDKSKLYSYVKLLNYFKKDKDVALSDYNGFVKETQVLKKHITKNIHDVKILEIGSGQRFARTLLFQSIGAQVVGIDTEYVDPGFLLKGFFSIWGKMDLNVCVRRFADIFYMIVHIMILLKKNLVRN